MRIPRILMIVALFVAAAGAALAPTANAQDTNSCPYNNTQCESPNLGTANAPDADLLDNLEANFSGGGGPSADTIPAQPTPVPAAAEAATDTQAPQLAFTGNESSALAYVGTGLVGFGALALVARRRMLTNDA